MPVRPLSHWLTRTRKSFQKIDTEPGLIGDKVTEVESVDPSSVTPMTEHAGDFVRANPIDNANSAVDDDIRGALGQSNDATLTGGAAVRINSADVVELKTFPGPYDDLAPLGNLDCYAIQKFIGGGGYGLIYKAYDRKNDRPVAIKLLKSDEKAKDLIANEAKRSSTGHPNLVVSYDYKSIDQQDFLVLEYVDGQTLQQRMASADTPIRQAVKWCRQVAAGLSAMHARGIPHLDLKPHNIMIRKSDDNAVIIDVGLDRIAVAEGVHRAEHHTPSYASPEQMGKQDLGLASDIYSFGVLLYQLLTRKLPHVGTPEEIKIGILHKPPPRPQEINKLVDATLDCIVMKCLQKKPTDRYATMLEVEQDLQNWMEHRPTSVYPLNWYQWRWLWARRHPVAAITMLALCLIGAGSAASAIVISLFWHQVSNAKQDLRVLVGKTLEVASVNRDMSPSLATMVANEARPYFEKVLDENWIGGKAADEVAEAQFNVAISLANMNKPEEAEPFADAADVLFSRLAKHSSHSANALRALAVYDTERVGLARLLGKDLSVQERGESYERAITWSDQLVSRYGESRDALELLASTYINYGSHLFQCSLFAESIQQKSRAIELLARIEPSNSTLKYRQASLEQDQVIAYSFLGQSQQADEARQRAQALFAQFGGDEFLGAHFNHLLNQGTALADEGLTQPAKTLFREASRLSMFALSQTMPSQAMPSQAMPSQAMPSQEFHWVASCLRVLDWQARLEKIATEAHSVELALATTDKLLEHLRTRRQATSPEEPNEYFQKLQLHGVRSRLKSLVDQRMLEDLETIIKGMPELYDISPNRAFLAREYALSDRTEDALTLLASIPESDQDGQLKFNMACVLSLVAQAQTTATPAITKEAARQLAERALALLANDQTQAFIRSVPATDLERELSKDLKWLKESYAAEMKEVLRTAGHATQQ